MLAAPCAHAQQADGLDGTAAAQAGKVPARGPQATDAAQPAPVAQPQTPKDFPPVIQMGDSFYYRPVYFRDARPQTALDMVNQVPGFAIRSGGVGRGLEGASTNILIDGRPLPAKGESVTSMLSKIPAGSVVGLYRVRGAQPGIDMQGYDEVLIVYRFPRSDAGATATLSAGRTGGTEMRSASLSGTKGKPGRAVSGGVNINRTRGGDTSTLVAADGIAEDVKSDLKSLSKGGNANADLRLDTHSTVRGDISYNRSDITSRQVRLRGGGQSLELVSISQSTSRKLSARLDRALGSSLSAALDGVHSDTRSESASASMSSSGASRFATATDKTETASAFTLRWSPKGKWRGEAVADYAFNRLDSDASLSSGGVTTMLPGSDISVTEKRWGASVKIGWSPEGDWSGGLRLRANHAVIEGGGDIAGTRSFTEIKPELTVQGKLAGLPIDLRLSREIDQLAFSAFTASARLDDDLVTLGNTQLDAERRWVAEATLRKSFLGEGQASLTFHGESIDNPTELVLQSSGYDALDNIGQALAARISAQASLPLDPVGIDGAQLDLNAAIGFSRVTDPTTGDTRRLSNDARRSWSLSFRHVLQTITLSYGISASQATLAPTWRSDEIDKNRIGPSLSGFAEYEINKTFNLRVQVSRTGPSSFTRILFAGSRDGTPPNATQVQNTPAITGAQVTLRLEI